MNWLRKLSDKIFTPRKYEDLTYYCMFMGYPRSGHSLVGSILDAHPNCIISHELDALKHLDEINSRYDLFDLIANNSAHYAKEGRNWTGYSYDIAGQWQGRSDGLKVIGDKKGGSSTDQYDADEGVINRLHDVVGLPMKIIHVIRNPYDIISTRFLRGKNPPELSGEALLDEITVIREQKENLLQNKDNIAKRRFLKKLANRLMNHKSVPSRKFDMTKAKYKRLNKNDNYRRFRVEYTKYCKLCKTNICLGRNPLSLFRCFFNQGKWNNGHPFPNEKFNRLKFPLGVMMEKSQCMI